MRRIGFVIAGLLLVAGAVKAQVLTSSPLFPTRNDTITITYDASQGNGALAGISPIYVHTGIITTSSTNYNDWFDIQDDWGTPDPNTEMTPIGNNKFTFTFNINSFYGVPAGTDTIIALGFVFRNVDGTIVGRNADATNIDLTVYDDTFHIDFFRPIGNALIMPLDSTVSLLARSNRPCNWMLTQDGNLLSTQTGGDSLAYNNFHLLHYGGYNFRVQGAAAGDTLSTTLSVYVNPPVTIAAAPAVPEGINYINDSTVTFKLVAPGKSFIYVTGDFNDWQVDTNYMMREDPDGKTWWLTITHLTPQKEYIFQYLVDGYIRTGDPYSDKISDPYVDANISSQVYPNLIQYPYNKTTGIASVLEINRPQYAWTDSNYHRPAKNALNIYELWIANFTTQGSYHKMADSLGYLIRLGINAIELMPIMNFEGVSGWGYNPNYFCAAEKVYGPADSLKSFIDLCHKNGVAVLLDIPFNDAFGTNPMVMMYWDTMNQQPAPDNPWFNTVAPHPYSVGYDFNHLSQYTINFVTNVTRYWLREYHADGYRFDLTKGYTQTYSGNNVGLWGQYDASRIAILEGMVDSIWAYDPNAFTVFEQLSENQEETELSNHGILLWGIMNTEYNQATMGYSNGWDISWASYQDRGWSNPNLVTYMESHDEERLMYNNEKFGDSVAGYDIKPVDTGCQRMQAAGAVLFTIPGPKMMLMFEELGFDISITNPCRECLKPLLWSYYQKPPRRALWNTWATFLHLRNSYPGTFQTTNYTINFTGAVKSIQLTGNTFDAVAVANFDVGNNSLAPGFQHTGWWYDFFSRDSMNVTNLGQAYTYGPAEFHLYTDIPLPEVSLADTDHAPVNSINDIFVQHNSDVLLYPNPSTGQFNLSFDMTAGNFVQLNIYDIDGRIVYSSGQQLSAGVQNLEVNMNRNGNVTPGMYFYRLSAGQSVYNGKISVTNE